MLRNPFSVASVSSCRLPSLASVSSCKLASLLLFLLCAACARRESVVQRGDRSGTLHRGVGYEVADLDPHIVTGIGESKIIGALFEHLVEIDPHGQPVPGVAERWDISPDALSYTFHLRADAKWSNGDPVTAQDFINSWRRVLTPSLAADYAPMLEVIRGAAAFHQGKTNDFATV